MGSFYFGGSFMFGQGSALWKYLANYNVITEKFVSTHGWVLPNDGPVTALRRIPWDGNNAEMYVAGSFTSVGTYETACNFVYKFPATADSISCLPGLSKAAGDKGVLAIGGTNSNDIWVFRFVFFF